MRMVYGLLADSVTPGPNGKPNAIGIFTDVAAFHFPCRHGPFAALVKFERDQADIGKHKLEIGFVDADYRPVPPNQARIDGEFEVGDAPFVDIHLGIEAIELPRPGPYEFYVKVDDRHLGSLPLHARQIQIAQPPAGDM